MARSHATAVLVFDLLTDFGFPDGPRLHRPALHAAQRIRRLLQRARSRNVPVFFVNDDPPHRWDSDAPSLIRRCLRPESPGRDVVESIRPEPRDHILLKPRHSACFGTALEMLLDQRSVNRLVLTGVSAHQCVLFTAADAHVRQFELVVPRDCIAAPKIADTRLALRVFEGVLGADTRLSRYVRWSA